MVDRENRHNMRFNPQGLAAALITIDPVNDNKIVMTGQVIDMSYGGIKIKLDKPFTPLVVEAELNITLVLPVSGVPVAIQGKIKHLKNERLCGLQYADNNEHDMDELMFECIKLAEVPHNE
jgi:hypothetical protein